MAAAARPPEPGSAESRWLPGLGGLVGLDIQDTKASVDSDLRGAFSGASRFVFPSFAANVELATPVLAAVPGRPRLFVQAEGGIAFDTKRNVVKEGTPGSPRIPIIDANRDGIPDPGREPPLAAVTRLGSTVQSQTEPLVARLGAGVAFTTTVAGRDLWIKPSAEYRITSVDVTTFASAAESINDDGLCPCRTALFKRSESNDSHFVGAGLEIEADAARAGPFVLTLFAAGRGYRLLGDPEIAIEGSGTFDDGKPFSVRSTFDRDRWAYGASIGLRVRWMPE